MYHQLSFTVKLLLVSKFTLFFVYLYISTDATICLWNNRYLAICFGKIVPQSTGQPFEMSAIDMFYYQAICQYARSISSVNIFNK